MNKKLTNIRLDKITLGLAIISLITTNLLNACPCFNSNFLHSAFKIKAVHCETHYDNKILTAVKMSDEKNIAITSPSGCELKIDYYTVKRKFQTPMDNSQCIQAIYNACQELKASH